MDVQCFPGKNGHWDRLYHQHYLLHYNISQMDKLSIDLLFAILVWYCMFHQDRDTQILMKSSVNSSDRWDIQGQLLGNQQFPRDSSNQQDTWYTVIHQLDHYGYQNFQLDSSIWLLHLDKSFLMDKCLLINCLMCFQPHRTAQLYKVNKRRKSQNYTVLDHTRLELKMK